VYENPTTKTRQSRASRAAAQIAAAPKTPNAEADQLGKDLNEALTEAAAAEQAKADPRPDLPGKPPGGVPKPARKPRAAKATPAKAEPAKAKKEPANPRSSTVDLVIDAVLAALPKTTENHPLRKLLVGAQKRRVDPAYVPNSSAGQRLTHSARKLVTELEALTKK
jgi:hypothetical protein